MLIYDGDTIPRQYPIRSSLGLRLPLTLDYQGGPVTLVNKNQSIVFHPDQDGANSYAVFWPPFAAYRQIISGETRVLQKTLNGYKHSYRATVFDPENKKLYQKRVVLRFERKE